MNRVKELRKQKKLSQTELARMLNVHQTAISQWETGRTEPDTEIQKELADTFNVSLDYLMMRDKTNESKFPQKRRNKNSRDRHRSGRRSAGSD